MAALTRISSFPNRASTKRSLGLSSNAPPVSAPLVPRVTLSMQPFLYVKVGEKRYRWVSFDVPKIGFSMADGSKGIHWDEDEVWCNFEDESTGEKLRMRLQDSRWAKL